ncbi:hypothetical protein ACFYN0_11225 [Streptomyces sp. NPDC006704]|uniref:hypothetical protein n=1 Tax=Streptomyces sp. NPDC006704 TaxID=3364760 RepID=UPI0036966B93
MCKHFAQVRGWPLAETVVETTPERPLELREGWARVMEAVSDGSAEVIAVYDAAQIGLGLDEFEVMQRDLRMREVVLTAVDRAPR